MANTTPISPLSLEAGAGLLNNTGIRLGTALTANVTAYESTTLVSKLLTIQTLAATANITAPTLTSLQTMGASTVPALGDSVPTAYQNTNYPVPPPGGTPKLIPANSAVLFSGIVRNVGATYLGNGDLGKFAQAYFSSSGYISLINPVILSAANANKYLGPTFTGMDNLITGDLAQVNLAFPAFGEDLAALGFVLNLANIDSVESPIGSPAALLQALSKAGNMPTGTTPAVRDALNAAGVTDQEITDLVTNNVYSLFNPTGMTEPEFNALQKRAYPALCNVTGADLQDVLDILDCTTPNITQMCELLNPVKIFPNSFLSLTLPTPNGNKLVYSPSGSVNGDIEAIVNSGTLAPVGCDELAKIVPPANAVGSKSLQIALQQVKNIANLTAPQLAAVLL
jgi:hypothetical protein